MSRASKIAIGSTIGLLAIAVVLLLNFDWNRAKPWINARVTEATGREFAINGDLSLAWQAPQGESGWRAWIPWPRLNARDVRFANPDWAQQPLMARAEQLTFSLNPLPLLRHRIVIPTLALDAPRLDLERDEDGHGNWVFGNGGQSRWKFELQRLLLSKGEVRYLDPGSRTDLRANIATLDADESQSYQTGWRLHGRLNGENLSGNGRAGGVLSLQTKGIAFPLEATLRMGKNRVEAQGVVTDPGKPSAIDLQLKISGVSMAQLYPLTGIVLPETRPFETAGRLTGTLNARGGNWTYENFTGKMGRSDVAGTLRYRSREPRALLEGTVVSDLLNFNDLSPLVGADSDESRAERGVKIAQPPNKVLPVEPFKSDRWNSIDADVQFTGRKLIRKEELPIDNVVTRIRLQDGVLLLAPLKFGIAGGNLVSNIRLDGKDKPIKAELRLSARHLKLRELFPHLDLMQASLGEINGDAALTARGNSIASLLGSSNGEVKAVINQGSISKLLLEQMGLNLGSVIVTEMFGDRQVQINCAVTDFMVDDGVMHANTFVVDTEDAQIYVKGDINLASEHLGLTIYPNSEGVRLISLRSPLHVKGTFKKPDVSVDKGSLAVKAGSALALGVLAPAVAALIPLVNVGPGEDSECGSLLARAKEKPVTASGGKGATATSGR